MKIDLSKVPPEKRAEAEALAAALAAAGKANPLTLFAAHNPEQAKFLAAPHAIVAAFCGNQCLAAGTLVRMADGSARAIENIVPGDRVVGVYMNGSTSPARVSAVHDNGVRPIKRWRFSKGGAAADVLATADHKLLVRPENGRNRIAPAARVQNRWLIQRHLGAEPIGARDVPMALLLGLLLGDGCCTGTSVSFTCADADILALARDEAARFGYKLYSHPSNAIQFRITGAPGNPHNAIKAAVRASGGAVCAHEKVLPPDIDSWDNESVSALLAGLLLTDGTVALPGPRGNHGAVSFCSTSEALAAGVKRLMEERFGVYGSQISRSERLDKQGARPEFVWRVANYQSLRRLQTAIPLIGHKKTRLDDCLERWAGKRSDGATLRFQGADDLGLCQTYDITVENETRLFALANGLVVSNSGKSTIGAVKALAQLVPRALVPEHLRHARRNDDALPRHGWALCPSEDKIFDSLLPALKKWCPPAALKGGSMARAFNGERMQLTFDNESTLTFKTYKQDADKLGGATLDFVWYDEPPPQLHRDESATRLLATGGPEWYTMTPLKSNAGWIRREIWRKRAAPHICVCKWSMHDNPHLDKDKVAQLLESYKTDIWRKAREFGDFMDIAGQVYGGFERCVIKPDMLPPMTDLVHIWGIDPGIRNAAVIAGGFDSQGVAWIYGERLIQNGTPSEYAQAIDVMLALRGMRRSDVLFVIDPAARQRSQATGDTVQNELARVGIFTANGANDREAGQQQIRDRILHKRLKVLETCVGLRDDADEFAWEIDDDDDIGPADDSPFHRLATLRYLVMARPFYPVRETDAPNANLGLIVPGVAPDMRRYIAPLPEAGPMGAMS